MQNQRKVIKLTEEEEEESICRHDGSERGDEGEMKNDGEIM